MANLNLSMFCTCCFIILSLLLCLLKNGYALEGGDSHSIESRFLTVETSSLLPSSVCDSSTKGPNKRASSLKLVHRHGPCTQQKSNSPTIYQILSQDQSRVSLIQSRIALASKTTNTQRDSKVKLPGRLGDSLGSSNYIVNIGLGTPKKNLSLIFDTGSDLMWTQCKPCPKCYLQKEPVFDPSGSSSYSNITCGSRECKQLNGNNDCESNTCVYNQSYNDKSSSRGFLAKETLTLTPTDVFKGFVFGCGQQNIDNNDGLFGETAGLLGLGPEEFSFLSQTNEKYGKYFSYCFPSKSSSTGHLTFGNSGVSSSLKFIPFSSSRGYYSIDIIAIYVGGTKLPDRSMVYTRGTVIDSGTVITRLPPETYNMLRVTFRQMMIKYPRAANLPLLDTCYNLSNYSSISVPNISFLFNGNVTVDMDQSGILYGDSLSQMCLAFSGINDFKSGIFGNVQQKTLEVVYDVARGKLGFGARGCS
ncbi:hypothetical protein LguiA_036618 [Lonicera macranthoides]